MSCHAFHRKISPWLDGELDDTEIQGLKDHLSVCPDCQRFYQVSLTVNAGMRSRAHILPAAALAEKVEDFALGKTPGWFARGFPIWLQVPVAAMLLIVSIGIGSLSGSRLSAALMNPGTDDSLVFVSVKDDVSIEDLMSGLDTEGTGQ